MDIKEDIFKESMPIWNQLNYEEKNFLIDNSKILCCKKGNTLHRGHDECLGLIIISKGKIKAFSSPDGDKQITLYRLNKNDICLFTASCMMKDITFDIFLECEEDTELLILPTEKYQSIIEKSTILSNFLNKILLSRFSDVMWTLEQVVFNSLDKRLAQYLLDNSNNKNEINLTHEQIASDLGTAREVISRLLKKFENEEIIKLQRSKIIINNKEELIKISN